MTFSRLLAGAAAAVALSAGGAHAATELIVNGGFDALATPTGGQYLQLFGGDTSTGWTVTGADILLLDKNYSETGLVFNAASPNVAADLTGAGNTGLANGVYQDVNTVAGKTYKLTFLVGNAGAYGGNAWAYLLPSTINLSVGGGAGVGYTVSDTTPNGDPGILYEQFTTTFLATGATTRIAFTNGTVGDNYAGLDDVSLTAVPEPATWAMMIGGFFGVGGALRQSRRRAAVAA